MPGVFPAMESNKKSRHDYQEAFYQDFQDLNDEACDIEIDPDKWIKNNPRRSCHSENLFEPDFSEPDDPYSYIDLHGYDFPEANNFHLNLYSDDSPKH